MLTLKSRRRAPNRSDSPEPPLVAPPKRHLTEQEFVAWIDEDVRAEWVDGEVIVMSPSSDVHVFLGFWLGSVLTAYVEKHDLGRVLGGEFMVRFASQRRRRMPDLLFVAKSRLAAIKRNHLEGAPDLAMEIVSPDSQSRDWRDKYTEYEKAGVREYWVIDPMSQRVEVYALGRGKTYRRVAEKNDAIYSTVLPGFFLKVEWLWPETRPTLLATQKQLGLS